jgi:adenylosuccinate synthase
MTLLTEIDLVLLLSGPMSAGKTTLRDLLLTGHGFDSIRSSAYLRALAAAEGGGTNRLDLQNLGDRLDQQTDYRWVVDDVAVPAMNANPQTRRWLFDAVRKRRQVDHFRSSFGARIFHLHLTAPESVLRERYERRLREQGERVAGAYDEAVAHDNERESRALVDVADAIVQTYPATDPEVLAATLTAIHTKLRIAF